MLKDRLLRGLKANYNYLIALGLFSLFLYAGSNVLIYTNKTSFCTSCHSMKFPYEEYKGSIHYKSSSG